MYINTFHPKHSSCYTRTDGKLAFLSKSNPQQINRTLKEVQKRRTHCTVKFQRAMISASLADRMAKRNQKPEEAEEAKKASEKTAMATPPMKAARRQKIVKPVKISAPWVGGKC
ncbi:unnamed protein product [Nyctereutes procyonoides]|uniref:(raccoon dog) hypothetical protein n=1 Tax=Nyctereutes procyonoides TaxID=34880 RepID=A0A811ZJM6_NYCPR|nr:unnamed protein product [Nyctereutes procyonoides]